MGLYFDSEEIDAITGAIKKQISVGICGSFTGDNKTILEALKEFLKEDGYTQVFTADDFPSGRHRIVNSDAKYIEALNTSMDLVNNCDIVIIFFFNSHGDPEVNQSALLELQELCSKRKRNVIVLYEGGFKLRSNLKGIRLRSTKHKWWDWDDFLIYQIPDCYIHVKQACHNFILERFVRRDV